MNDRSEELARIRERAKTEMRDDATIRAMAIAKARGETYSKVRHGPFEVLPSPRSRASAPPPDITTDSSLEELLERFLERGAKPPNRYLRAS